MRKVFSTNAFLSSSVPLCLCGQSSLVVQSDLDDLMARPLTIAAVNFRHLGQSRANFRRQLLGPVPPSPVAAFARRDIHTRAAVQSQDVLQRNDRGVGDRTERQANE